MANNTNYNKYLEVSVSAKNTAEGDGKIVSFFGIKPADMPAVLNRLLLPGDGPFRKPNPLKNIVNAWAKGGTLFVKVAADKAQAFLDTGLKSIVSALVKSGNYDNDKIVHLEDEASFAVLGAMSKEEMNKLYADTDASVLDMWTQYLNNINDPEVRKALELYSKIYGKTIYGHALSLKNVMSIKAVDPNATFVLGKSTWASFGRGVKANAKKFPLWRFTTKHDASEQQIAAAQEALGHGLEEFGNLGVAVQNAIQIEAQKEANKKEDLIPIRYIGYDISDTYLYDANEEDPLLSKPNMSSNVVYEINALAKEVEAEKAKKNGEGVDDEFNKEMLDRTDKAVGAMEKLCKDVKIDVDNIKGDPEARLVDMLMQYYLALVPQKANVLKAENVRQYAEDAVQLTLCMDNIALNQLNRFHHSLQYTQKEASALAPIIRKAVGAIGRALVEAGDDDFMAAFYRAMKKVGIELVSDEDELNSIKESFNNYYNRINSVKF